MSAHLLALVLLAACPASEETAPPGVVEIARDRTSAGYSLSARNATLDEIGRELQRVTGCRMEVNEELRKARFTLKLSPRPSERIYRTLARRAGAMMSVDYRLERSTSGGAAPGPLAFARDPVVLVAEQPAPVEEVLRRLDVPVELEEGLGGSVRLLAVRHPLRYALDRIAAQLSARWYPRVRLEARKPVDAEDAETDRMLRHLTDLSDLPPRERREEIHAELERLEGLPPDEQPAGLAQMARDVLSLATLLRSAPGEHREGLAADVLGVAWDYGVVLSHLPRSRREHFQPVAEALAELRSRLAAIR